MKQFEKRHVEKQLENCYELYKYFEWLTDAYVLDFYNEECWQKLPNCWQKDLECLDPMSISNILSFKEQLAIKKVLPLSLLSLRRFVQHFDIPRQQRIYAPRKWDDKLEKLLWKHMKPKKQHEIKTLAHITYENAVKANCQHVVDVGSGLGHLCRSLAYGYGLKVCGIEAQKALGESARKLDSQFESFARKIQPEQTFHTPVHVNMLITAELTASAFVEVIKIAIGESNMIGGLGIVALHACGDLCSYLLKLYDASEKIRFLNIVGCCYMKLSLLTTDMFGGYPMSCHAKQKQVEMTYNSREVACHAIENYVERLNNNLYWQLKVHSYRAALEFLLKKYHPEFCQSALSSVKYSENLSFHDYCEKALKKLSVNFDRNRTSSPEVKTCLNDWNKVVIFYSLRLLLAPIVETIVLLDRYLFLLESSENCDLIPAFNPKLSPRNHVLSAIK